MTNQKQRCRACKSKNIVLVEYSWDHPEHHDGWSETLCMNCKTRFGRWSGRILKGNDSEKREEMYK